MQIYTFSYTGNGSDNYQPAVSFPWTADAVLLRGESATNSELLLKTAAMTVNTISLGSNAVSFTGGIKSLDATGITLGTSTKANENAVVFHGIAFKDDGAGDFNVGTYTGNGTSQTVSLAYNPALVITKREGASQAISTTSADPLGVGHLFGSGGDLTTFTALTAGFSVNGNATVNANGSTYYYLAFKATGKCVVGSYVGNGTTQSLAVNNGFQPVFSVSKVIGGAGFLYLKTNTVGGSSSLRATSGAGLIANQITSLDSNGFSVGASTSNSSATPYVYWAFRNQYHNTVSGRTLASGRKSIFNGVIPNPTGWTWSLPFNVLRASTSVVIDPSFNLETYANISVSKTYYVSTTGSDGNSGIDENHALRNVKTAMNKVDADQVLIKAGTFRGAEGWNNASPNRNMKIKGYGGSVILSLELTGLSYAAVSSHYEATTATAITCVVDASSPDVYGDSIPLIPQANSAAVNTTPGSWYYDAGATTLYVHTLDSRSPDSNILAFINQGNGVQDDAVTYYVEGIDFWGGTQAMGIVSTSASCNFYAKNCSFKYDRWTIQSNGIQMNGGGEVILQGCVSSRNSGDGFKPIQNGAQGCNLALINCIGRTNGLPSLTSSNGYSRHDSGNTVTVNCEFFNSWGRNSHSINNGGKEWHLGTYCHDPLTTDSTSINFEIDDVSTMWLDSCRYAGALVADVYAGTNATIYYRNMGTPVTGGPGTIVAGYNAETRVLASGRV